EQMIGVSRKDVIGRLLSSLPNRAPTKGHLETDEQIFSTRKPLRYETTVQARDGTLYNVIVAKTPLLAEDGTLTGIASVVTDISDQKRNSAVLERARVSAEAAVQAKSRFLANMSHELRTPLNGVVGMTSLLENTTLDARQRRFVRTLRSSAEALITLINDVLDLSKAEAGKLELARGPVDLRRELEQVVGLFSGRAWDKGIDIAAHIGRDVPAVIQGDPIRLRQVFSNLVNNAVKFTDSGAVLLAVNLADGDGAQPMLEFSVSDTGVGVAPDEQKRVFEAFEQADDSVTRRFGGTGLGLAICRQLVELMDGHMGVTSPPGGGSRFFFVIPAGTKPAETRPRAPAADFGAIVIGMHPVIGSAACEILGTGSAQVLSVATADAAVDALRNFDPQFSRARIVVDSGDDANLERIARSLHAAAGKRQLEVIALLPPNADVTPVPGVHRCLVKPLCTPDLIATVSAVDAAHSMRVRALPVSGSRGRALVVEDNAVNQEMARAMLDMLGFEVVTASNGLEGVTAALDPELVLILMDCQMPVMDGLAAARAIRAGEPDGRRVPIIALTGNAMPGDRDACVAAGMDDYLAKPFSLTALRAILDRWTLPVVNAGAAGSVGARNA
ncbi:MAG TPA: ATP-binding protein, partial [Steroidobacteraceae bacterium]|nr:ATP-binding protein [Steroidobacteraceae bacterium]